MYVFTVLTRLGLEKNNSPVLDTALMGFRAKREEKLGKRHM